MYQKNTYFEPHGAPKTIENAKKLPPEKHLKNEPGKVCKNDQNKPVLAWEREARLIDDMLRSMYDNIHELPHTFQHVIRSSLTLLCHPCSHTWKTM